jgi:putative hemolysin
MQNVEPFSIAILGACLLFSAFFSGTEAAFLATQRHRLRHLAATGSASAATVERLMERPEKFLSTVLVGNNFFNTAAAALATTISVSVFGTSNASAVLWATGTVTIALLVIGEITPKTVASRHAERTIVFAVHPFRLLSLLLAPVAFIFNLYATGVARVVGRSSGGPTTADELQTLVTTGVEAGTVEEHEAELVQNVFRFGDRMVREIMTPRSEIAWIKAGTTFSEFLTTYAEQAHSRFPVFDNDPDQGIGFVSIKDVLRSQAAGDLLMNSSITSSLREAHYVPETKRISDLLQEMRADRSPVSLVVDEFGGIAGLVTLRRLVEEVVGRVEEEGERTIFQELDERTAQVDGFMNIEDLNEQLDISLPDGGTDYETVAGFIMTRLGHIPTEDETVEYGRYTLTIARMNGSRIEEVLIRSEGE